MNDVIRRMMRLDVEHYYLYTYNFHKMKLPEAIKGVQSYFLRHCIMNLNNCLLALIFLRQYVISPLPRTTGEY